MLEAESCLETLTSLGTRRKRAGGKGIAARLEGLAQGKDPCPCFVFLRPLYYFGWTKRITRSGCYDMTMNSLNIRVGQWLAILTVFVALGRGLYDAYLTEPGRLDGREQMKIVRLERKLAAMQNSDDKQAREKLSSELVQSYVDTCQYKKADPLVLQSMAQLLSTGDANRRAQALVDCGNFYGSAQNVERAEICYVKAIAIFVNEKNYDAAVNGYLSLARVFQSQAEVMPQGSKRLEAFTAAEKWLGEAVKVARQWPLSQSAKAHLRNTYLLLLAAEGRSADLVSDLARDISNEPAKDI